MSNLLMVITNAAAFLQEDLDTSDPRQVHVARLIHAGDRGTRLTQQLQAIGRSQLLNSEVIRPGEIVRSMSDTLRRFVPDDVDFGVVMRAPTTAVMFDRAQFPVIVMNLVSYAAERVRSHGHLVLVIAEEVLQRRVVGDQTFDGPFLTMVVAQTGLALDDAEKSTVFQPRLAGKRLPRGTDLRLASVDGIVAQSGGFVEATSQTGKGSAFTIYLPAVTAEKRRRPTAKLRVQKPTTGSEVVLVVEDDATVRNTVREGLERYGYTVLVASDGSEALRLCELLTTPPDLLITDLVMPEVTGRELIQALALRGSLPKVLMMSGYTDDGVLRRSTPAESYPFLRKPFSHVDLARKVRDVLDG